MTASPLPRNRIIIGDVRKRLLELPDASVDCVINQPAVLRIKGLWSSGPARAGVKC